jgi:ChrB-like protein
MSSMQRWVLLAYRLPREPSTPRIALWRSLRRLGAAQVGDGLVALPLTAETQEQLEWLGSEIEDAGGEASVWLGEAATRAQGQRWMDRFREAATEEYRVLRERAKAADRLGDEAAQRRALRVLRADLRRVRNRDYFHVSEGNQAEAAIERLAPKTEEVPR